MTSTTLCSRLVYMAVIVSLSLTGGCDQAASKGKEALEAQLKDPDSVKYKDVVSYSGDVVCGEYNAKNEMGGYTGFKKFITLRGKLVEGDQSSNHLLLCNNRTSEKIEVDDIALKSMEIQLADPANGEKKTWNTAVFISVSVDNKYKVNELKEKLSEVAQQVIREYATGPKSWAYGPGDSLERQDATKEALQVELEKHTGGAKIRYVSLIAY